MPLSSSASMTGTPRVMTLPTTTTSGRGASCAGFEARDELDAERLELRAHGWIDVLVRPVTRWPAALAMAAMPPMNVPQMPRM